MIKKTPQNKLGRMEYMKEMLQFIEKENIITFQTKIRGTSIEKLCEFDGGPYKRVIAWLESKVFPEKQKIVENSRSEDMILAEQEQKRCYELMLSRNNKYGDSYKCLTIPSIANLCEMKLNRIAHMDTKNLDPKIEDELMDVCNYMIFGLIKLKQQKK